MENKFSDNSKTKLSLINEYSGSGKHIGLLYGGISTESEISKASAMNVLKYLLELNYRVTIIDIGTDVAKILSTILPGIVFNCLHGALGEDGCVPGMLNIMNIPYTHSGILTSALCFNKYFSKNICVNHGIVCPKAELISENNLDLHSIELPYVIKPLSQGSSIGVEIFFNEDSSNIYDYKFKYGKTVLLEEYILGQEINVCMLNGEVFSISEKKFLQGNRFYDYNAKYNANMTTDVPAQFDSEQYEKVSEISKRIYAIFGCRGVVRLEFIYDTKVKQFYFLEINTHPGMTKLSIVMTTADSASKLVQNILLSASVD